MTTTSAPPNVVVIYADDLGWGDLGCFGADDFDTPALDALARQRDSPSRVVLELARMLAVPSLAPDRPVPGPRGRGGDPRRYPAHRRACLRSRRLATALRDRGYATGIFGKWHLGADPAFGPLHYGFDTHFGFRAGCVDYYSHIYYWGAHNPIHDLWADEDEVWLNGEYLTDGHRRARQ